MVWIEFLDKIKQKLPTKTAVIDQNTGVGYHYQSLWEESHRWANWLNDQGVKKGDCVVLLKTNSLEHLTILFGCARIGAIFIPMNFRLADEEKREILDRVKPKVFISDKSCSLQSDLKFFELDKITLPTFHEFKTNITTMNDPLLMLFTSGTTGTPKGVMFHGKMLQSNQRETCHNWELEESDRCMVETPFFHTGGYNVLALPLLSLGGTIILAEKFEVNNVIDTIVNEKITVYFGVPTMFHMISEQEKFKDVSFDSVRFFISGGAYCPVNLIESFQQKNLMFKQGFGLTEVGPNCFLLKEEFAISKVGSIGRPMNHSRVLLLKENGAPAEVGEVGELLIGGDHVCLGYFAQEKRFKECLFDDYFKTGDLAQVDEDGFYYIVGRKKDMYISGGENVYPAEVEKKLITHPNIQEAVVLPIQCEKWGEVGYAFIRSEIDISVEELREYLNPLISRYKHPHFIERLNHFPLLESGKVDRNKLKNIIEEKL